MTKKHFKKLAEAISNLGNNPSKQQVAIAIANVCKEFNPAFSKLVFLEACNLPSEEELALQHELEEGYQSEIRNNIRRFGHA